MKDETRKKIEAKWHQLITENDKPEKPKSPAKTSPLGAKVIRRRKGQIDLPIS